MTRLFNDPATFTEDMLAGFLDANAHYVSGVPGGVVRSTETLPARSRSSSAADQGTTPHSAVWSDPVSPTERWSAISSRHRRLTKPRPWPAPHTETPESC